MSTQPQITDDQYTDAQLSDGTTLRFKGQLSPAEVRAKVAAYRAKQIPPTTAENPIEKAGRSGTLGTVAREGALGLAAGAGLPETTNRADFSLLPGLKTMVTKPWESTKLMAGAIARPMAERFAKGVNLIKEGGARNIIEGGANLAAGAIPIVGPAAYGAGEELGEGIKTGDPAAIAHGAGAALGTLGTLGLATKPGQRLAGAAMEQVGAPVARTILKAPGVVARAPMALAERLGLRVPEAPKALRQAIQPGINIPRAGESIDIAGPRLAQVAKSEGIDFQRVTKEKGENTGKLLDVTQRAKHRVWDAMEQRLGPVAELSPNTTPVAVAMDRSISGRTLRQFPAAVARIRERANTYRDNLSLREIETSIEAANNDLRNLYKRPSMTDSPISAEMAATQAEVRALRSLLDKKVEELSGAGVKDLKREYGALRDVERATARQHAVQTRVKGAGLWEGLAALHAAGDFISGNAVGALRGAGTLAVGRRLQLLRNPDFLIEQAFHGNRPFVAAPEIPAAPGPQIRGLLPAGPVRLGSRTAPIEPPSGPIPVTHLGTRAERLGLLLPAKRGTSPAPQPVGAGSLATYAAEPTQAAAARPVSVQSLLGVKEAAPVKSAARTSTPRSESLATYNSLPEEIRQAIDAQVTGLQHMPQALREGREQQLAQFGGKGTMLKERLAREAARDEGLPVLGEGMAKRASDIKAEIAFQEKRSRELNEKMIRMKTSNWPGRNNLIKQMKAISEKVEKLKAQLE